MPYKNIKYAFYFKNYIEYFYILLLLHIIKIIGLLYIIDLNKINVL